MSKDQKWSKPGSGKPEYVKPHSRKLSNGGYTTVNGHFRTNHRSVHEQSNTASNVKNEERQSNNNSDDAKGIIIDLFSTIFVSVFPIILEKGGKKVINSIVKRTKPKG